jgi:hypothetical protein
MGQTPKFTLRFHDAHTHARLGLVADHMGISRNRLAEQMLERELAAAALLVERDLDDTLSRLRGYRREEQLAGDIEAFAEGEALGDDPLRARMVESLKLDDAFGVMQAFEA